MISFLFFNYLSLFGNRVKTISCVIDHKIDNTARFSYLRCQNDIRWIFESPLITLRHLPFKSQLQFQKLFSKNLQRIFPNSDNNIARNFSCLYYTLIGYGCFKSNQKRVCLIIILMHRYGLVYLWHNKQLENQNRSVTKERRDGQAPSPPRNKSRLQRRHHNAHQKHPTSIYSDPSPHNSPKNDDTQVLQSVEIRRAKAEVQKAKLRVQKAVMDVASAEKRVSEMQVGLKGLAGGDTQNKMAYNNLLQLARRESERRQKERLCALGELQSKEQLLACLTHRKSSM